MAFNIGELVGYVKLDHSGVRTGMQSVDREVKTGMDKVGQSADQGGKAAGKRFGDRVSESVKGSLKSFASGLAAGFAVDKVVQFIGTSISAASDLQQTVMKSNVIFGENARAMESWATTAVDSVGLSKNAALGAASSFGDMFRQLGFTGDRAAKMSTNVVQLAADLGSFNNLETGDVLDRISAALRGEYDSLQQVIPNINAARVENEALAQSGKRSAKELTAQEKATATLAIIQKDGAKASGDFARSNGTLAIEQQKLNASLENFQAMLGEQLLPVMTDVVEFGNNSFLPFLNAMVEGYKLAGSNIGNVTGTMQGGLLMWALQMKEGTIQDAVKKHQELAKATGDAAKGNADVAASAQNAAPKVADYSGVIKGIEDASKKAKDAQKDLAQAMLDVTDAASDSDSAQIDYQQALADTRDALKENGKTLDIHKEKGRDNKQALIDLAASARDAAQASLENNESVKTVADTMATRREDFVKLAMQMNGGNKKAAEELADKYGLTRTKVDEMNTAMGKTPKEVATSVKVGTAAAMASIAAVQAALKAIKDEEVKILITANTTRTAAKQAAINDAKNLATGGEIPGYAGGTIIGPGTGTSDSILAISNLGEALRVSAGEYISTASSAGRNKAALEAGNRGATLTTTGQSGPIDLSRRSVRMLAQELANVRIITDTDAISRNIAGRL